MNIKPTQDGGRQIGGVTPFGSMLLDVGASADGKDCRVVDAEGNAVGTLRIDFAEPKPPRLAPEIASKAEAAGNLCRQCEHVALNGDGEPDVVFKSQNGFSIYSVKCTKEKCNTCGGKKGGPGTVRLTVGRCPVGTWDNGDGQPAPVKALPPEESLYASKVRMILKRQAERENPPQPEPVEFVPPPLPDPVTEKVGTIDVVYPFVHSGAQDEELRYSLRSLERFMGAHARVWVVGDKPKWLTDEAIHLPHKRKGSRWCDSTNKVLLALKDPRMGERFVLMHDDFYLLQPSMPEDFAEPWGVKKTTDQIEAMKKSAKGWLRMKADTLDAVKDGDGIAYDCSHHMPILYERAKFLALAEEYGLGTNALSPASLYWNTARSYDPESVALSQYRVNDAKADIERVATGAPLKRVLNHSAGGFDGAVKKLLKAWLPDPCRWDGRERTAIALGGNKALGDGFYKRPLIAAAMKKFDLVYLVTSFPDLYRDMGDRLRFVAPNRPNATHAEHQSRQAGYVSLPPGLDIVKVSYPRQHRADGCSFVKAMERQTRLDADPFAYFMPPQAGHAEEAKRLLAGWGDGRPVALIHPPTLRQDWLSEGRNPTREAMQRVIDRLRETHRVVSVARLDDRETLAYPLDGLDVEEHAGFPLPLLVELIRHADVVATPVCAWVPIGLTVHARMLVVFGGHASPARVFDPRYDLARVRWAAPDPTCDCLDRRHACIKPIAPEAIDAAVGEVLRA